MKHELRTHLNGRTICLLLFLSLVLVALVLLIPRVASATRAANAIEPWLISSFVLALRFLARAPRGEP